MEIFLYVIIFLDLKTINAFIQLDSYQSYLFLFFDFLSQLKAFLIKIQWNRTVEDLFFRIWLSSKVWGGALSNLEGVKQAYLYIQNSSNFDIQGLLGGKPS